jgi:hypothetical protein
MSSQKNASPSTENGPSRSYTVLYYKRKNKVHKSKGVSKMDGFLTIEAPPKSVVTLSEGPNQKVVFRGVQRELASGKLHVDDTIQIGSFEAEILSIEHDTTSTKMSATATTTTGPARLAARPPSKFRAPNRDLFRPVVANKPSTMVPKRIGYKPAQPKKKKPPPKQEETHALSDNHSSSDEEDGNGIVAPQPLLARKTNPRTSMLRKRPFAPPKPSSLLVASKQPRTASASASAFTRCGASGKQPLRYTSATAGGATDRTIGRYLQSSKKQPASSTSASPSSTFFPGAVGNVDVPHSVRKVLKPHQIEGIAFLWNCLTGNTQAAQVSPHNDRDAKYNGAILADEMGLGKTLMTIAVTCALHRRNRSMVRFV